MEPVSKEILAWFLKLFRLADVIRRDTWSMYYLCTPNGREEGPLTEAQVAERIHTRRLTPASLLRGPSAPEPKPVSSFYEFKGALRQFEEMTKILEAPRRSRMAVVSLVFGILALVSAVVAFTAGSRLQQRVIRQEQEKQSMQAEQARLARETARTNRRRPPNGEEVKRPPGPRGPNAPAPGVSPPSETKAGADGPTKPSPMQANTPPEGLKLVLVSAGTSLASLLACLILGGIALVRLRKGAGRLTGSPYALGGLGCAGLMLAVVGFGTWQLMSQIPVQQIRKYAAYDSRMKGLSQLHQVATADGKAYPAPEKWCETLLPLLPANSDVLGTPKTGSRFGYNFRLEGKRPKDVARDTVVFFELRKPGWNRAGGADEVKRPGDLEERVVVVTASGRAVLVDALEVDGLRWEP
jgi:type II secretory pathway pseudopilin PulG